MYMENEAKAKAKAKGKKSCERNLGSSAAASCDAKRRALGIWKGKLIRRIFSLHTSMSILYTDSDEIVARPICIRITYVRY